MKFKVCEDVSALGIKVVFLVIFDIDNTWYDEKFENSIHLFYKNLFRHNSLSNLESDSSIIGYRQLHKNISITDKSVIASPESLINFLFKHKHLKPINFIVDVYNYISIKNKLSIGGHDLDKICGNVRLCFAEGNESFVPMGSKTQKTVSKRQYCYIDDSNEVICWLDCRQCEKTKISPHTKNCLFILQGHTDIPEEKLLSTAEELQSLIQINAKKDLEPILKLL